MNDEQGEVVDGRDEDANGSDIEGVETEARADVSELAEQVEERDPADVAEELVGLREQVDEHELQLEEVRAERDDLEDRLKRKQAEFQNYKKRQQKRREEERERATEDLVSRFVEVRDNLKRALDQEEGTDIRDGVEATFRQLEEVLSAENVDPIEPEPGAEVDPQRHEVLLRVESDQPEGTVDEVQRPGYEMAGKVLRPAQVTVAE